MKIHEIVSILILMLIPTAFAAEFVVDPVIINLNASHGSNISGGFSLFKNATQSIDFDSQIIGLPFTSQVFATASNQSIQNYTFSISVPKYFLPGTYTGKIKLQSDATVKYVDVSLVVPADPSVSFAPNVTSSFEVSSGSSGYLPFPIVNSGNVLRSINGTSNFNFSKPTTNLQILPGSNLTFPLYYDIPRNVTGNFTLNLVLSNGMNQSFNLSVIDDTPPIIIYTERDVAKAGKPFNVKVAALDNFKITNVTANGVELKGSGQVWAGLIKIDSIGNHNITFTVFDGRNNISRTDQINVGYLEGFNVLDPKLPQVRIGDRGVSEIFNTTEEFNFTIVNSMATFIAKNSTNLTTITNGYRMLVQTPTGEEIDITNPNENKTFIGIGTYKIILIHDQEGEYTHRVSIRVPEFVSQTNVYEKEFKEYVSSYTLIAPETQEVLLGTRKATISCRQYDGGALEKSYTVCDNFTYEPNTQINDLNILTSKSAKDAETRENERKVADMEKRKNAWKSWFWVPTTLIILEILFAFGIFYIRNSKIIFGKQKEDSM